MPTTSNFGWTTPADTDLVKDGAAAIRTLGNGIDTSLVDLKGGTTGQNLRKASNTDLDFTFAGDATNTVVDAAGDLLYGTASDTLGRLAIGTAGQVLKVNSGATAPEWGAASSGALTLVSATTFSAVASHSVDSVFTSTYKYYRALLVFTASGINTMTLRWRASSSDNTSNAYYAVTRSTDSAGTSEYASTVPGTASAFLGKYNSDFNSVSFDIFDPQVASKTLFTGTAFSRGSSAGGLAAVNFGGGFDGTNAFDGMTLIASSGTITGTLKIYGYQN